MTTVGRTYITSALTPGIPTGSAHQTGQVIGSAFALPLAGGMDGGGVACDIHIIDRGTAQGALTLFLFNAAPAHQGDGAQFDLATAGVGRFCGLMKVESSDYVSGGKQSIAKGAQQWVCLRASAGQRDVYGVLVSRTSGLTYTTASPLTVMLGVMQD